MKYCLFIVESGDHGLSPVNKEFPVFALCGVIMSAPDYLAFQTRLKQLKNEFWPDELISLHSKNIRDCEGKFSIFFNKTLKDEFYRQLSLLIQESQFSIIASVIHKEKYKKIKGRTDIGLYEIALSFIIERTVMFLDGQKENDLFLEIVMESRGKKENKELIDHFNYLRSLGTGRIHAEKIIRYGMPLEFKTKNDLTVGLELADLLAYPIATAVHRPHTSNPAFEILQSKFYTKKGKIHGLKIYPL